MTNEQADALIDKLIADKEAQLNGYLAEIQEITRAQHQINMAETECVRRLEAENRYMKTLQEVR